MQENNFNAKLNPEGYTNKTTRLTVDLSDFELKKLIAIKKKFNIRSHNQAFRVMISAIYEQNISMGNPHEN